MKNKIFIRSSVITVALVFLIWFLYQTGCYVYWYLMAWSGPAPYDRLVTQAEALPSEEVIKRLHSFDIFSPYPQMAIKILAERKEKKAVPELTKLLKSWNKHISRDAIWALGIINDKRAIEPLMDIIRKREKDENCGWALLSLAKMKHEGAFKYIVDKSKEPDAYRNGSVGMLEEFGAPECIPLLLDIKDRIRDTDPLANFGRSQIDDAIKHIESLQATKK